MLWRALEVAAVAGTPDEALSNVEARFDHAHDAIDERLSQCDFADVIVPNRLADVATVMWGCPRCHQMGPLDSSGRSASLRAGSLMVDLVHEGTRTRSRQQPANPTRMSRTVLRTADSAPPSLGYHTHEVLREVLGLDISDTEYVKSPQQAAGVCLQR